MILPVRETLAFDNLSREARIEREGVAFSAASPRFPEVLKPGTF
jgi:hypothetical protein